MSVDCLEQRGFNGLQVYCDCYISAGLKHLGLGNCSTSCFCFLSVTAEDEIGYFCHFEASKQYFSLQTPPVVACLTSDVHLLYTGKKLEYPNQDVYRPFAFDKSIK
ncbi:Pyruvate kinase [Trichinella pseudospiralis]